MTSKLSRAKPAGSILAWQALQVSCVRCLASCSRIVMAPRISGSIAGTLAGGGGGGLPKSRVVIQAPRLTGEVVVPFAVTFNVLACVRKPPRTESFGKFTGRTATPSTFGMP